VRRALWIRVFALCVVAGLCILAGCPNTNTGILPSTGVDIPIGDLLMGADLTCNDEGTGDVFIYAAIVNYADFTKYPPKGLVPVNHCGFDNLAGGVFQCYTAGAFGNLPLQDGGALPDGGTETYSVQIYFFSAAVYNGDYMGKPVAEQVANALRPLSDGGGNGLALCDLPWTWATTCTAIEEDNIVVNTSCPGGLFTQPLVDAASRDAKPDSHPSDGHVEGAKETSTPKDGEGSDAPTDGAGDVKGDAPPG
jgi:hypothetical protein